MASLAKLIEDLQELERQNPGSEILLGAEHPDSEATYINYRIVQKRVAKKVWRGIRWIAPKAKTVAFVLQSARGGKQ